MEIIIGKTSGFCFGVKNAIEKTEEHLKYKEPIYCLGELVHNKQVIDELQEKGVIFIEDIEKAKGKVIIRAHGAEKNIYEIADRKNIEIIDLTCPKVTHIHRIAQEYAKKNYYIFLIGKKEHPEIIATQTFCGEKYSIIDELEEVEEAINKFLKSNKNGILILPQTTYSISKFNEILEKVNRLTRSINVEVKNTICNSTHDRQSETKEIAKDVESMIIVGGKHSSNTTELYQEAKKYCSNVQFVENSNELELKKLKNINKIGIMAGASTPENSVKNIVEIIEKM